MQKQHPRHSTSTAEATLGRIGRGVQGEAGGRNSAGKGLPHREQTRKQRETWSEHNISMSHTTGRYDRIYIIYYGLELATLPH